MANAARGASSLAPKSLPTCLAIPASLLSRRLVSPTKSEPRTTRAQWTAAPNPTMFVPRATGRPAGCIRTASMSLIEEIGHDN
jgi:hypothetical protein